MNLGAKDYSTKKKPADYGKNIFKNNSLFKVVREARKLPQS